MPDYTHCRLCGKPRNPEDTMDNPKPCGCPYTDAMRARDILERIHTDINLAAEHLDVIIGRNIIRKV